MTPNQLRGAHAMLGLSQGRLSKLSGISTVTINALEGGRDFKNSTMAAIRAALEAEGAVFYADGSVNVICQRHRTA